MPNKINLCLFKYVSAVLFVCIALLSIQQGVLASTTVTLPMIQCECGRDVKVTGTVTVTANPGLRTVKIAGTGAMGEIGISTAEYTVKAGSTAKAVSCGCSAEIKPVNPRWSTLPHGTNPPPVVPTVATGAGVQDGSEEKWEWTPCVYSSAAGEWKITFNVKVTYDLECDGTPLLYASGNPPIQKTVEFPGKVTFTFKATTNDFRIVLLPDDNFYGRNLSALGVGETGVIKVEPIGTTLPADIFPLQTFSSSNPSAFAMPNPNLTTGTAAFTAGDVTSNTVVTATDKNGNTETYSIDILEPKGVRQEKITPIANAPWVAPNPNHDMKLYRPGECAVAMNVASYLEPTDISFHKIKIDEGTCKGVGTGSQQQYNGWLHPRWTSGPADVSTGDIIKGCLVKGPNTGNPPYDFVGENEPLNVGAGTFTWKIPWEYKSGSAQFKGFTSLTHKSVYDGNRGVTITKGGNSVQHTTP